MSKKQSIQSLSWNLTLITLGSLVYAIGAKAIIIHHKFIIGGLYGTSLFIYYKTNLLSPGIWYLLLNIPLLVVGWIFFSRRFFFYSFYGICILALFSDFLSLDFAIKNQLYAAIAGGAICGAGGGIILRSTGSGGGLDIIAILLSEKYNFGVGKFFMLFNVVLFTFVLTQYEPDLVIASIILTFVSTLSLEQVLALFNQRKIVYVLSDHYAEIVAVIGRDLRQGATLLDATGAHTGKQKKMVMAITNNLQLKRLEAKVFGIDPQALFIVENSFNVIGSTFGKRKIY